MNKNNAHLFLPLVAALAEGKTLQYKSRDVLGGWSDHRDINFSGNPEQYRIKPEPEVLFMVGDNCHTAGKWATLEEASRVVRDYKRTGTASQKRYKIYRCEEILES